MASQLRAALLTTTPGSQPLLLGAPRRWAGCSPAGGRRAPKEWQGCLLCAVASLSIPWEALSCLGAGFRFMIFVVHFWGLGVDREHARSTDLVFLWHCNGQRAKRCISSSIYTLFFKLCWGLNPRPPACQASTLPPSYIPSPPQLAIFGTHNHDMNLLG